MTKLTAVEGRLKAGLRLSTGQARNDATVEIKAVLEMAEQRKCRVCHCIKLYAQRGKKKNKSKGRLTWRVSSRKLWVNSNMGVFQKWIVR